MAKDRNTMAKRQREVEKRRKADEKREKRNRKKTQGPDEEGLDEPVSTGVSVGEAKVLTLFRKYLMTPGQMLCLNSNDLESLGEALEKMVADGLLVPESMKGGYALTRKGFEAMNLAAE